MQQVIAAGFCGLLLAAACGGGGQTDADAGGDGGDVLECAAGEIRLEGELDGQARAWQLAFGEQVLTEQPLVWILYPDDGGRLRFELAAAPDDGGSVAARVTLSLGGVGGPDLGNCSGHPSTLQLDGDQAAFALQQLSAPPFCSGQIVAGELAGCARWSGQ